jgi:hypothetical protein
VSVDEAISELTVLEHRLRKTVLHDSGAAVLQAARVQLELSKHTAPNAPWSFEIPRDQPLTFGPTTELNYALLVDLFGQFSEVVNGVPSSTHSVTVRLWALQKNCWFDEMLDAQELENTIENGLDRRVMLRFRFDYADPDLDEPWFHLQVGGQQTGEEYFRLPANFGMPRFSHHPLNLLMACEFIIRHFFPDKYDAIANEASWRHALAVAQRAYLTRFLLKVEEFDIEEPISFLHHCWA